MECEISLSWLCDACGYENEFNDESQPTECLCCGESAPPAKIIELRYELEKIHAEEERKARLEEIRRRREKRQEKIDSILIGILNTARVGVLALILFMLISVTWVGISFYQKNVSLIEWYTGVKTTISLLPIKELPITIQESIAAINIGEKVSAPFQMARENLCSQGKEQEYFTINEKKLMCNMEENFIFFDENISVIEENIACFSDNYGANCGNLVDSVKENFHRMIENFIKIRGKKYD